MKEKTMIHLLLIKKHLRNADEVACESEYADINSPVRSAIIHALLQVNILLQAEGLQNG